MGQPLTISETALPGVMLIASQPYIDERGAFSRWFCLSTLQSLLGEQSIRQINHSLNLHAGTVRGMHYQKAPEPEAVTETKLVRCIAGRVYDVVLDLRSDSPTYGQHIAVELSAANQHMLLIPPGCAHGFQALEDNSQLLYLHTQDYRADWDAGVRVDDPAFAIQWPLPIRFLSERDKAFESKRDSGL